jgi:hypothetical protein
MVAGATAHASRTREGGAARALLAFRFIAAGILVGPALLAAGNVRHSPTLKLVGALLLVVSSLGLTGQLASVLRRRRIEPRAARALLAISTGSLVLGMTLVAVYALGEFSAHNWLSVPEMACFHGTINAVGFALCGLLGWALARRDA